MYFCRPKYEIILIMNILSKLKLHQGVYLNLINTLYISLPLPSFPQKLKCIFHVLTIMSKAHRLPK